MSRAAEYASPVGARGVLAAAIGGPVVLTAALVLGLAGVAATIAVPGEAGSGSVQDGAAAEGGGALEYGISARARTEIPPEYLRLYVAAGRRYGLDWAILAGIGTVECGNGRDPAPSCTRQGVVNAAGAGGPAQFLASTWSRYGVSVDGNGPPNRWDPADAIFSMANYLRASGAPANYRQAIYAYNHAWWYVAEVERWAALYRGAPTPGEAEAAQDLLPGFAARSTTPVELIPGERALLAPGDGHLALIPRGVPPAVQAMVMAGNELQDLPYGPTGHPDPLGASSEDCSSTVNYVLYRAGVRPLGEIVRENPLAQNYVNWGLPGPGRWVTIYATTSPTDHVFMVIAGLRLDTSHDGTDVGPNRDQNGPRWRILDEIPNWAHWSVRHPAGL